MNMCITICYHTYAQHDERINQGKLPVLSDQQNLAFYQPKRNNFSLLFIFYKKGKHKIERRDLKILEFKPYHGPKCL
jgi:hypothetical protein